MYQLFVSHSTADKALADAVVDFLLLDGLGLDSKNIFYSSRPRSGVPGGVEWFPHLRDRLGQACLTLLLATPAYLSQPFCLLEAGAAWIKGTVLGIRFRGEWCPFLDPIARWRGS